MKLLRKYIRMIILEAHDDKGVEPDQDDDKKEDKDEDLLVEPDASKETGKKKASEVNAIGMGGGSVQSRGTIRGVTTPLGTGPTYPAGRKKKKKKSAKSGGANWYKAPADK